MSTIKFALVAALFATLTSAAQAQTLTREGTVTAAATITAIDSATRTLTLRNDKGEEDSFTAGPDVTRFNQLKVGDKIRLTYHESLVLQLRKPGAASNSTGDTVAAGTYSDGAGRSGRDPADTDCHREGRGPEGAVHHRHDTGRAHGDEEGRRQEEHRKRRGRRSHRHHLHAGGGRQRRAGEVAAIPSARRPGPRGSRHCRSQAPVRPCRLP